MELKPQLTDAKGTYCLVFGISNSLKIATKKGKSFQLKRGIYAYAGSAFGGGGLRKRVSRHLRKNKKKHWHIDFITSAPLFYLLEVWSIEGVRAECELAGVIAETAEPIPEFGASDCRCQSHLFRLKELPATRRAVQEAFSVKIHKPAKKG